MMPRTKSDRIRVGDRVVIATHPSTPLAKVIEDRGNLGVGGRRLVRIRLLPEEHDPEDDVELEIAEEDLRPASP